MNRYVSIFLTCARACLVRDMTFRANFILECVTSLGWMSMNLAFYLLIFQSFKILFCNKSYRAFINTSEKFGVIYFNANRIHASFI